MQTQFTRHVNYCKNIPLAATSFELSERLRNIVSLYQEFKEIQSAIEDECGPETIDAQYVLRGQIEDYYFLCAAQLQGAIDEIQRQQQPPVNPNANQQHHADIKLPRIKIPQFFGEYKQWPSFKDTYVSLIHNNRALQNVQKFHYLKDNIKGTAEQLISSLHVTDDNYPEAWKRISGRFEHKRFIVDSHLQSFFNQERIQVEDPMALKNLIDNSTETVRSLQVLGLPVNHWDSILVHVVASKLDHETHKQWELKLTKDQLPTFQYLEEFLEARWQSLEMIANSKPQQQFKLVEPQSKSQQFQRNKGSFSNTQSTATTSTSYNSSFNQNNNNCNYCAVQGHTITNCGEYLALSYESKNSFIKSKSLCFNCLRPGHSLNSCKSKSSCLQCGKRHHTTIHRVSSNQSSQRNQQMVTNNQISTANPGINASAVVNLSTNKKRVLLATANVNIITSSGQYLPVRALIDQGSEHSIIQEKLAKQLGLIQKAESVPIIGIGEITAQEKTSIVKAYISSCVDHTFKLEVELCTMKTITAALPTIPVERKIWPHFQGLKLADEHFNRSLPIQLLLGAEVFEEILLDGVIKKVHDSPTAINSSLGWLLFGKVNAEDCRLQPININFLQIGNQNQRSHTEVILGTRGSTSYT